MLHSSLLRHPSLACSEAVSGPQHYSVLPHPLKLGVKTLHFCFSRSSSFCSSSPLSQFVSILRLRVIF